MAEDRGFSDLFSTASTMLNSHNNSSKPTSSSHGQNPASHHTSSSHKPSYGQIYSSANVIMDAAKAKLHKTGQSSEELDKAKLAGAAGTLIGAASHYAKIDGTSYGKYAHKAEEYLHSYGAKHGNSGTSPYPSVSPSPQAQSEAGLGHGRPQYDSSVPYPAQSHGSSGYGQDQAYASQSYSTPPAGYPTSQQGYGHNKPAHSQDYVAGYPPPGYPTV